MEREIVNIVYFCDVCGRRRILKADKNTLDEEIKNPLGNGLAELIDFHICKEGKLEFYLLNIDSSYTVRNQTSIDFFSKPRNLKPLKTESLIIPIPEISIEAKSLKQAKIPDFFFSKDNTKDYYLMYEDFQTGVKVEINKDNFPAEIRKIISHDESIKITYAKGDSLFENWVDELMIVNEISHPSDAKPILYQLLYLQEKMSNGLDPTTNDNEILVLIAMIEYAIVKINCRNNFQEHKQKVLSALENKEEKSLFEYLFDHACDRPVKIAEILGEYKKEISITRFFELLVKLSHMQIIILDF